MGGLSLRVGGFGGVRSSSSPKWGQGTGPSSVTQAAFGPGYTAPAPSGGSVLAPNDGFGVAFWMGVGAIAALCFIRYSLPG